MSILKIPLSYYSGCERDGEEKILAFNLRSWGILCAQQKIQTEGHNGLAVVYLSTTDHIWNPLEL